MRGPLHLCGPCLSREADSCRALLLCHDLPPPPFLISLLNVHPSLLQGG